mmetsp:Transcript_9364/g.10870  ORF Transcript_9364/g.10870 Transcript_9364/m.10870 type:complete len:276 (+) Transcript_9364:311-1138(+)|eukprot:CAMPEP_0204841314 /NCGR_PEP_ID=MMETSP1346-20131115/41383_1 /ASSEMBLY_ACC=CAM_ASM_000771 /TAXON_ID=215587 /ORGANISM="Aplanochytrium stocchinoi, Strain GSBS06" /LENGTH=275 /DNA_ID=CAMNT_0051979349 /DNA_START=239 /DNA_END=1066 /DNA_ORIENTATION=-
MAALDMGTLKHYVVAEDHLQNEQLAQGTVSLLITHSNLQQQWPEIRIDLHTTVGALKDRLYRHGGTGSGFQKLILKSSSKEPLCELSDDTKMLGFYGVQSGMEVHIVDTDPYSYSKDGGLENVNLVVKYVMADEDYAKRPNALRNYKNKMREKDPYWTFLPENRREPKYKDKLPGPESVKDIPVGARCEVQPGSRRGVVSWTGEGEEGYLLAGYWVGVTFDEPLGKNDGSIKDKQFFTCPKNYGAFVRPDRVNVGDFPELDLDDLDSDSDEEYTL